MPKNLGIDETKLAGEMRLILTDPNHRKVLDIYDSNTPDCFRHYFAERAKNYADLGNIKNIVIDMNAGYMSLIKEIFDSSVKIVIDRYSFCRPV
jgi:transposase